MLFFEQSLEKALQIHNILFPISNRDELENCGEGKKKKKLKKLSLLLEKEEEEEERKKKTGH